MTSALQKAKNLLDANKKPSNSRNIEKQKSGVFSSPLAPLALTDFNNTSSSKPQAKHRDQPKSKDTKGSSIEAKFSALHSKDETEDDDEDDDDKELQEYLKTLGKVTTTPSGIITSSGSKYMKTEVAVGKPVERDTRIIAESNTKPIPTSLPAESSKIAPISNPVDVSNKKSSELLVDEHKYLSLEDVTSQRVSISRTSEIFKHKPEFGKVKSLNELMASSESESSEQIDEDLQSSSIAADKSFASTTEISISILSTTESRIESRAHVQNVLSVIPASSLTNNDLDVTAIPTFTSLHVEQNPTQLTQPAVCSKCSSTHNKAQTQEESKGDENIDDTTKCMFKISFIDVCTNLTILFIFSNQQR